MSGFGIGSNNIDDLAQTEEFNVSVAHYKLSRMVSYPAYGHLPEVKLNCLSILNEHRTVEATEGSLILYLGKYIHWSLALLSVRKTSDAESVVTLHPSARISDFSAN